MAATEMNRVTPSEIFQFKRWNRYRVSPQIRKCLPEARKVFGVRQNRKVGVPAKLGRAVEHARLSAHEERAHAPLAHRRKDFAYRVRDQVSLRARGRFARVSRFPASVALG